MAGTDLVFAIKAVNEAQAALKSATADIERVGTVSEHSSGLLGRMGGALGDVAKIAGGFVVAQGLLKLPGAISGAIGAASDLNESMSKMQVVFGSSAPEIEKWASTAAQSLGQSKQAALESVATFGNFLQAMGQTPAAAKDMSTSMVQLAADLASFNNANPEDVILALRSGLSGESEPMRKFGVALSEAAVAAKAAQMGIAPLGATLTDQQKIAARYAIIMDQTKTAQGDFARTSDGLANKQRILDASMADLSARIGGLLLPVKLLATEGFLSLIDAGERLAGIAWDNFGGQLTALAGMTWDGLKSLAEVAWDGMRAAWDAIAPALLSVYKLEWTALTALASLSWDKMQSAWDGISQKMGSIPWGKVKAEAGDSDNWAAAIDKVKNAVQPAIDVLKPLAEDALKSVRDQFKDVAAALGPFFEALKPLEPLLKPLGEIIGVVIVGAIAALLIQFRLFTEFVTVVLVAAINGTTLSIKSITAAFDFVTDKLSAWLPAIGGALGRVWDTVSSNVKLIVGLFTGWAEKMYGIGEDIVNGLKSGITDMWDGFVSFLTGLFEHLPKPLRKVLESLSPSKVFARIGEDMVLGAIEGVAGKASDLIQQVSSLGTAATAAMSAAVAAPVVDVTGIPAAMGGAYRWNPVGSPDEFQAALRRAGVADWAADYSTGYLGAATYMNGPNGSMQQQPDVVPGYVTAWAGRTAQILSVTIHAVDAKSFVDLARDNGPQLVQVIEQQSARGY